MEDRVQAKRSEEIDLHRWNTFHLSPPPPTPVMDRGQSSKVGSIWRIRDVSEGPMTHTLSTPRRFLFSPLSPLFYLSLRVTFKSRWSSHGIVKEKTNHDFFFPPRCLGIDRPKSNIHTPEENLSVYLAKTRDGIYAPWHEQRHRRHRDPEKSRGESNEFSSMREKEKERESEEVETWKSKHDEGGAWFSSHAWNWKTR